MKLLAILICCFFVKSDAQSLNLLNNNIYISWENKGDHTKFFVMAKTANINVNDAWLGIGFNTEPEMEQASVVVCRTGLRPSVQTYWNNKDIKVSNILDAFNPTIGLTNTEIAVIQNNITCLFDRANNVDRPNYLNIKNETINIFIIAAYGAGEVNYHAAKDASSVPSVFFDNKPTMETTSASTSLVETTTAYNQGFSLFRNLIVIVLRWIFSMFGMI